MTHPNPLGTCCIYIYQTYKTKTHFLNNCNIHTNKERKDESEVSPSLLSVGCDVTIVILSDLQKSWVFPRLKLGYYGNQYLKPTIIRGPPLFSYGQAQSHN